MAVEVPLADVSGLVASLFKDLSEANFRFREARVVEKHAGARGITACEQGGAMGSANGTDGNGILETEAFSGEAIDVGSLDVRIAG